MNILMIGAYKPQIGGVSHVVQNLVKRMKKENSIKVINMEEVGGPRGLGHWKDGDIDVYQERLLVKNHVTIQALFQTTKRAWELRKWADIYHSHGAFLSGIGFFDHEKPMILTVHGYPTFEALSRERYKEGSVEFRFSRWMEKEAVARADAVVAVGETIKKWVVSELGAEPEKVFYVPNGVDISRFNGVSGLKKTDIIKNREISVDTKLVTYAKSIDEVNGIRTLIRSIPLVIRECPEAVFLIVGDGSIKKEMMTLAEELGVMDNVIFYGPVVSRFIPDILSVSDIFCVPFSPLNPNTVFGVGDTLGISHLEAMGAGLPTIGTKKTVSQGDYEKELDETIIVTGFDDPVGLSKAIIYLLSHPKESKRMGERAREYVLKNYTWEKIAARNLEVYRYALEHHRKK